MTRRTSEGSTSSGGSPCEPGVRVTLAALYGPPDAGRLPWGDTRHGNHVAPWVDAAFERGLGKLLPGHGVALGLAVIGSVALPFAVPGERTPHHPVLRPSARYFGPFGSELTNGWGQRVGDALKQVSQVHVPARLDRVVLLNSCGLDLQGWPDVTSSELLACRDALVRQYPERAIVCCGIRPGVRLAEPLRQAGFFPVPARPVYVLDAPDDATTPVATQEDWHCLDRWRMVDGRRLERRDHLRCTLLQRQVGRGWPVTPPLSVEGLRLVLDERLWRIRILLRDDRVDGILGWTLRNQSLVPHLVGVDGVRPDGSALERALIGLVVREAAERSVAAVLPVATPEAARARGATTSTLSYGVYADHLPERYKAAWQAVAHAILSSRECQT